MDKLFLTVLNMSLTGAFVVAAICLARLPLRKAPKIISYSLWAVVGFRLTVPFSIESMFSLIPFKAQTIPTDIATQAVPLIDSGIPAINNAVNAALPAATSAAAPAASVNPLQFWTTINAYVWIAGVALMLLYGVVSYMILKRKMSGAVHVGANIYETENIKSPFVLGFIKPKIYLPIGLSEQERGYILLHEQTHILRRDDLVKFGAYFILCLHWFNPLVWVAFMLMGKDMEMSCDERVLRKMGGDISDDYSMSLVRIATGRRILNSTPLAFGEGGVKERVKNILSFRKPSRVIIALAVAFVVVLSVGFAVNQVTHELPGNWNLVIVNHSSAEIFSIGLSYDNQSGGVQNADNSLIKKWEEFNYEMGERQGLDFRVMVSDKDWNIIAQASFTKDFTHNTEERIYLYIIDDGNDAVSIVDSLPNNTGWQSYTHDDSEFGIKFSLTYPEAWIISGRKVWLGNLESEGNPESGVVFNDSIGNEILGITATLRTFALDIERLDSEDFMTGSLKGVKYYRFFDGHAQVYWMFDTAGADYFAYVYTSEEEYTKNKADIDAVLDSLVIVSFVTDEPVRDDEPDYITHETTLGDTALILMSDDFIEFYVAAANRAGLTNRSILEESALIDAKHLAERTIDYFREERLNGINRPLIFQVNIMPHDEQDDCITVIASTLLDDSIDREVAIDYIMEPDYPIKEIRQW